MSRKNQYENQIKAQQEDKLITFKPFLMPKQGNSYILLNADNLSCKGYD